MLLDDFRREKQILTTLPVRRYLLFYTHLQWPLLKLFLGAMAQHMCDSSPSVCQVLQVLG